VKGIQDDIRTISASTAIDPDWPVENVLDDRPSNKAKGTQNTQTLTLDLGVFDYFGGSNALYLGNTNARTGTLKVYDLAKTTLYETFNLSFSSASFFGFLIRKYFSRRLEVWQDYTYRSGSLTLEVTLATDVISAITITAGGTGYAAGILTVSGGGSSGFFGTYTVNESGAIDSVTIIDRGTGITAPAAVVVTPSDPGGLGSGATLTAESTIELGICRAGYAKEFRNPDYGFREGFRDYSVRKKFHNGAEYYRQRGITRTFKGSALIDLAEIDTYNDLLRQGRQCPIAWNLLDDEQRGIVFAKATVLPEGNRPLSRFMKTSFDIEEVL